MVEFGQLLAGPYVGTLLGDFGADVVKIEAPPGRRPDARLGPAAPQRPLPLVVDPRPQQALRDAQPAHGGGPGARAPAVRRGRRRGRELPPRHDGEVGPGPRRRPRRQPARHLRPRLGLRPDRALPRPRGLRLGGRGARRVALHQRPSRPGAAAQRHLARRHARRPVGVPGHPARPLRARRARRPRPDDRRLDHRRLLRDDGVGGARVRADRLRARADGPAAAAHRAVQRLPLLRRQVGGDRGQPRHAVEAARGADGAAGAGRGPALRLPPRARRARGRARRADRRLGGAAHRGRARPDRQRGRRRVRAGVLGGRHPRRPALPRARAARRARRRGAREGDRAGDRAEAQRHARAGSARPRAGRSARTRTRCWTSWAWGATSARSCERRGSSRHGVSAWSGCGRHVHRPVPGRRRRRPAVAREDPVHPGRPVAGRADGRAADLRRGGHRPRARWPTSSTARRWPRTPCWSPRAPASA